MIFVWVSPELLPHHAWSELRPWHQLTKPLQTPRIARLSPVLRVDVCRRLSSQNKPRVCAEIVIVVRKSNLVTPRRLPAEKFQTDDCDFVPSRCPLSIQSISIATLG